MKKSTGISLIIISFFIGFLVCEISFKNTIEVPATVIPEVKYKSGVFQDLFFESLRKDGDSYYIKFSKQMEDQKFPSKCYLDSTYLKEQEDLDCIRQGRPLQEKENTDIDLSKEYKFIGRVSLIHYSNDSGPGMYSMNVSNFYDYINKKDKPNLEYYGGVLDNPKDWGFEVVIVDNEVKNISQIYQE